MRRDTECLSYLQSISRTKILLLYMDQQFWHGIFPSKLPQYMQMGLRLYDLSSLTFLHSASANTSLQRSQLDALHNNSKDLMKLSSDINSPNGLKGKWLIFLVFEADVGGTRVRGVFWDRKLAYNERGVQTEYQSRWRLKEH